jgi:RNA polymerase sigma-70 factor, ECF subfamily
MARLAISEPDEESWLVERARRGDRDAIRRLVQRHNRRLFRIARSILRNDSDAEDALQDAYVRAIRGLDGFRGEARFGTWLARIVINEALGALRRRRPSVDIDAVTDARAFDSRIVAFPGGNQRDPETTMAQEQVRVFLESAVDALPEGFREILVARLIEGMSVEETAEAFGVLPQTVKTRLFRARAMLRDRIEQAFGSVLEDTFPFDGVRCERLTAVVLARLASA